MVCYSPSRERHQGILDSSSFEIMFPSRCCCCLFLTSTKLTQPTGEDLTWKEVPRNEAGVQSTNHGPQALPHLPITQGCTVLLQSEPTFWTYLICEWSHPRAAGLQGQRGPSWEQHLGGNCWWRGLAAGLRTAWPCCRLQLDISRAAVCSKCAQPAPVHFLPPTSTWTGVIVKAKCISMSYSQDFRSW